MKVKKIGKDVVEGNGNENIQFSQMTKKGDKSSLLKRARAKYFTNGIVFHLLNLDTSLRKGYWNTYHCSSELVEVDGKIVSKYCKNRWCMICNRIRTAVEINKYKNILDSWDDKYFVTLTIVNVKAEELEPSIVKMGKKFYSCVESIKYKKFDFFAFRKLETTFNPFRDDYHPHYHLIVNGKEQANMLVDLWLKRNPTSNREAQDIRPIQNSSKDIDKSYIELFKYFTKILSSKSSKSKDKNDLFNAPIEYKRRIYVKALDVIFRACHGKRTYAHYGFKLPKENDDEVFNEDSIDDKYDKAIYYTWINEIHDWVNKYDGQLLTNYKPTTALKKIIDEVVV